MFDMYKDRILVVAFLAALGGCHLSERSGTCPPIQNATRAVITGWQAEDRVLTDPVRIRQLIAFANARREVSQPRFYTMPAPGTTVTFYRDADFVGTIGVGRNFFFASCSQWKGIRKATAPEIDDFEKLIGVTK